MAASELSAAKPVTLTIDGRQAVVPAGTTLWEAARQLGIDIPALCHDPALRPVGVCRLCVVDVGERVLAPSCVRPCADGMTVRTATPEVVQHRTMLLRLLLSDYPPREDREPSFDPCRLEGLAQQHGLTADGAGRDPLLRSLERVAAAVPAADRPPRRPKDRSSAVIEVDHQACILCDRCIRACDEIQSNDVIARSGKGYTTQIAFDLQAPMGESSCVSCGECAAACPTDALTHRPITLPPAADAPPRTVDSVCPYCGVGCAITYHVRDNQIVRAEGRASPVNHGRLCVKGRYGWDYAAARPAADPAADSPRLALPQGTVVAGRGPVGERPPLETRRAGGLRRRAAGLSRSVVGRGPGPGGPAAQIDPRHLRRPVAGGVRFGQVLE